MSCVPSPVRLTESLGALRSLAPTARRSSPPAALSRAGNVNDIETFRKYIEGLPLIDNPEVFGLHMNADLAYRTMQTAAVLETILDVQPKESGGGGGLTREEIVLRQVDDLQVRAQADAARVCANERV